MLKIKGIYDGTKIVLLEPVSLQPNTPVEVLIPEQEQAYWQRLIELGLVKEAASHQRTISLSHPFVSLATPFRKPLLRNGGNGTSL